MTQAIEFDEALIRKYDQSGPRYTSYPTAVSFTDKFTAADYVQAAEESNADPIPQDLSLYFHIPFCDTVCFYCACNKIATKDRSLSGEYLTRLFREMTMQSALFDRDRKVEQLHWGGGTPTFLNRAEMMQLMEHTRRTFNLHDDDKGDYSIEIDPRSVSGADINFLRDLGFNRFSLGVQDVNPKVQVAVNRIQPIEETQAIIDACRAADSQSLNVDLIYGLPFQTVDSFSETIDAVIGMSPDRLSVFNYAHLPHLFKPQRRINADELPRPEEKLEILKLSIDKLTAAGYVYVGMDHFAKPDDELVIAQEQGRLHRNFQGYSTHEGCDLVAMGVSSISKVGPTYSQNAKSLEEYYAFVDRGEFPIIKGIAANADDLLRRKVIQRLTCDFALDFKSYEAATGINVQGYFGEELIMLKDMADDGLLTLTDSSITIQPKGRLLVRNICMVFDTSLRDKASENRFSRVL